MPNRNIESSLTYRYAYQGQEKDPETGKEAFELRLWDGRIGRWLTTDPYNAYHSPYLGMGNNPITNIDPDGGCPCSECPENCSEPNATTLFPFTTSLNQLDEVTIVGSRSGNIDRNYWSSELNSQYDYGGTFAQWQQDYGYEGVNYPNALSAYRSEHGYAWENQVEEWDKQARSENAARQMLNWGRNLFIPATAVLSPTSLSSGLTISIKGFNYTPRYTGGANIKIHGNSLKSPKPTWFYKLYKNDGTFLKNGITSQIKPQLRYTKAFMQKNYMNQTVLFPNRLKAYNFEYLQNTIQRGPLNLNMH